MLVQILFSAKDRTERGMITWENGFWEVYGHESFARGWELASWLKKERYEALLKKYKLDPSKVKIEKVIHLSPSQLEKLGQSV